MEDEKAGKGAITSGMDHKPSLKERQRALREEAILDSAVELIAERGFASVTLEQIADVACVSKPTLYQHFRSKEDLVVHISLRCLKLAHQRILSVPMDLPIEERLRGVIQTVAEFNLEPKVSLYIDLAQRVSPIRHGIPELTEKEDEMIGMMMELLVEAQKSQIVRQDLPASFLCEVLVSVLRDHRYDHATTESATAFANQVFGLLGMPSV